MRFVFILPAVLLVFWWLATAPAPHYRVGEAFEFPDGAREAAVAVDQSRYFADALEVVGDALPGHDDIVFPGGGSFGIASVMDGQLWEVDTASGAARPFADVPLMAAGLHESPVDDNTLYFCASHLWGEEYPAAERVGLYRIDLTTREVTPVVLEVPDTVIDGPILWPLADPAAPSSDTAVASRPLAFCNDLEVSADGRRIYFTEPFAYAGAAMGGGTAAETVAFNGNGRVWLHDLDSGVTRLVAQGFFFPDGSLYDQHPDGAQEQSLLLSLTPGFSLLRVYLAGPLAGRHEWVQQGLPGMCDGLDRDAEGNIWCGLYTQRTALLDWLHANPWAKHVLLRLPLDRLPQPTPTGILGFSPGGDRIFFSALYDGPAVRHIASVIPGPDGHLYLTPFWREHRGLLRLPLPHEQANGGAGRREE